MVTNNATNTSNPVTVPQGGSGDASLAAYQVLCGGTTSTGSLQVVSGTGISGQVLTSQGAGVLPQWANSQTGGWVLLSSQTASSSASITFTSLISATYSSYVLLYSKVIPATAGAILQLLVSINNGSSYISTAYQSGITYFLSNSSTPTNINTTSSVYLSGALSTTGGGTGIAYLLNVTNGGTFYVTGNIAFIDNSSGVLASSLLVGNNTAITTNALSISMSTGNISSGTFTLYGVLE